MFMGVCVIIFAINPNLISLTAPPLLTAALSQRSTPWLLRTGDTRPHPRFDRDLPESFCVLAGDRLSAAAWHSIVVGRLRHWLGGIGAMLGAAVIGFVDVDTVTVSLAR